MCWRRKGDTRGTVSSEGTRGTRPSWLCLVPAPFWAFRPSVCQTWVVWVSEELTPPSPKGTFLRSPCAPKQSALSTRQFQPLPATKFVKWTQELKVYKGLWYREWRGQQKEMSGENLSGHVKATPGLVLVPGLAHRTLESNCTPELLEAPSLCAPRNNVDL